LGRSKRVPLLVRSSKLETSGLISCFYVLLL
jgi:hypothetical protein